jgi:putative ABC transport system permease protein
MAAILTVSVGFMAMVLFGGYIESTLDQLFVQYRELMMFGDVNIEKQGLWTPQGRMEPEKFSLDPKTQDAVAEILKQMPEVSVWSRFLRLQGMASTGKKSAAFMGIGYDLETGSQIRGEDWKWNTLYGLPLEKAKTDSVVLGQGFAKKLGCLPDPPIRVYRSLHGYAQQDRPFKCSTPQLQFVSVTATGQMSALDLEVSGLIDAVFRDLDSRFLMMPLPLAQSLQGTEDISYISVLLKDPRQTKKFVQELQKVSDEKGLNLKILDWRKHRIIGDTFRKTDDFLTVFKTFLGLVLLGIAALSVLNTMVRIVKERTREIGTWRSLGYTNRQMVSIFAVEAIALGLIGVGFGTLVSLLFTFGINSLEVTYRAGLFSEPSPFAISVLPMEYLKSGIILIVVCCLASIRSTQGTLKKEIFENMIS